MSERMHHGVSESLLAHIGDVTVSFAQLEMTLHYLFYDLLGGPQRLARAVCTPLSFRMLRQAIASLYIEHYGKDADEAVLANLLSRASQLEEDRNKYAHSWWSASGPNDVRRIKSTVNATRGLDLKQVELDAAKIGAVADALKILANEIFEFMMALSASGKLSKLA